METAPLPANEPARVAALLAYHILDTPAAESFDVVTGIAAGVCDAPIALIGLIDSERQWFKSAHGLPGLRETSRDIAFCAHAILHRELMEVPDAWQDERFRDNPLVTGEPNIRFYAGVPLIGAGDHALGTLCVMDRRPRSLSAQQRRLLQELARLVVAEMETCRSAVETRQALEYSAQRFRHFAQLCGNRFWETDANHCYTWVSESLENPDPSLTRHYYGTQRADVVKNGASAAQWLQHRRQLEERQPFRGVEYALERGGVQRWIRSNGSPVFDAQGVFTGYRGTDTDITLHKQLERTLYAEKERVQVTLDSIGDAVITTNASAHIDYLNPVAEKLTGWSRRYAKGRSILQVFRLVDEKTRKPLVNPVTACLTRKRTVEIAGHALLVNRTGGICAIQDSAAPIRDRKGQIVGAVLVFSDISRARELERQLTYQATHDALTGVVNRREFERRLQRVLDTGGLESAQSALCFLDLDRFKVINDTCGHGAGDELLRRLALLFQRHIRQRDTLARLGGDEFGILLEHCSERQAMRVAETLLDAVREFHFDWEGKSFQVGVSIGLVSITGAITTISDLLRAADAACYVAKESGRNRIRRYSSIDRHRARRRGEIPWVTLLQQALDDNRFRLFCQPIEPIGMAAGAGPRYELLLRMELDDGELLTPDIFLPVAERYQLSTRLDRWVVGAALRWLADHPAQARALALCSINLSGASLGNEDFHDFVRRQFDRMPGVPTEKLCFEVGETVAIANLVNATRFMNALKPYGCRFALDHFGGGLSSFNTLKTIPVDFVKIDGVLVRDIADDPIDLAMVRSMNDIGQLLGIQTIAEFVENEAVLEKLRGLGVNYAQGYHLGYPQRLPH